MSDEPALRVEHYSMPDTGLGKERGFASDKAMIDSYRRMLDGMPPARRERIEKAMREAGLAFVFGR